jgi:hypothetical protein
MSGFQGCSHDITTATYQTVLELTTHAEILKALCHALDNISISCPILLRECFAPEDVNQMKQLHIQEMKEFLMRIAKNRVSAAELDECAAVRGGRESADQVTTWQLSSTGGANRDIYNRGEKATTQTTTTTHRVHVTPTTTTTTIFKPVVVINNKQQHHVRHKAKSYDDYYESQEDTGDDTEEEVAAGEDKLAHSQLSMTGGGGQRRIPPREATAIGGDDEGHWEGRGLGQVSTLTSGAAVTRVGISCLLGLGPLLLLRVV